MCVSFQVFPWYIFYSISLFHIKLIIRNLQDYPVFTNFMSTIRLKAATFWIWEGWNFYLGESQERQHDRPHKFFQAQKTFQVSSFPCCLLKTVNHRMQIHKPPHFIQFWCQWERWCSPPSEDTGEEQLDPIERDLRLRWRKLKLTGDEEAVVRVSNAPFWCAESFMLKLWSPNPQHPLWVMQGKHLQTYGTNACKLT